MDYERYRKRFFTLAVITAIFTPIFTVLNWVVDALADLDSPIFGLINGAIFLLYPVIFFVFAVMLGDGDTQKPIKLAARFSSIVMFVLWISIFIKIIISFGETMTDNIRWYICCLISGILMIIGTLPAVYTMSALSKKTQAKTEDEPDDKADDNMVFFKVLLISFAVISVSSALIASFFSKEVAKNALLSFLYMPQLIALSVIMLIEGIMLKQENRSHLSNTFAWIGFATFVLPCFGIIFIPIGVVFQSVPVAYLFMIRRIYRQKKQKTAET